MGQNDNPATAPKQKQLVEFLITSGADVEKRYKFLSGWTPLMLAASSGRMGALEALISAGAHIEAPDDYEYTPLMRAAMNGHAEVVKLLLEKGADVQKKVGKNDPLKLAREGKKEDSGQTGADFDKTIALLERAGARGGAPEKAIAKGKKSMPDPAGTSKTLKAMEISFVPHKVPPLLAALCNYWDKSPEFFAGSFEIDAGQFASAKAWFKENEAGWSQVRIFGIDGIHSLYGVWFRDGKASDSAPIIYLGGEGEGTTVMASTWEEFLAILASNQEWEPNDRKFFDPEANNEEQNAVFCEWLKEKLGVLPAKNPGALMAKAKKQDADFQEWLAKVKQI